MAPIKPTTLGEQPEKPVPRVPKSPSRTAQIQAQNRRREYLSRHPSYFDNLEHELAAPNLTLPLDPVLYERLVKRFQSASEREAEGKAKGYGRTLEADLQRGELKLSRLKDGDIENSGGDLEHPWEKPAADKAHGLLLWHAFLEERFVHGLDDDFDYKPVDADEDLDTMIRRDAQDAWFDDEEPSWIDEDESSAQLPTRQGETGVQDF
ncbi:unnamed protein product [Fusarium fujikuroi]|uniref:CCD97-like C-terminal domain-containing protein n=1 Tax=Fusarium fujikuroi TaxID=5127 RepID=A0A9Q9RAS8_FUSFU|nr:unnamed protein product [Fusarium fujikuroi]VTT82967.1 unnamed protein product [Fusarium fujikuroi]VZH88780.1 unnamed protein product [Fusarium fujikuroi]